MEGGPEEQLSGEGAFPASSRGRGGASCEHRGKAHPGQRKSICHGPEAQLNNRKDAVTGGLCAWNSIRGWSRRKVGRDLTRPTDDRKVFGFYFNGGSHWFKVGEDLICF